MVVLGQQELDVSCNLHVMYEHKHLNCFHLLVIDNLCGAYLHGRDTWGVSAEGLTSAVNKELK